MEVTAVTNKVRVLRDKELSPHNAAYQGARDEMSALANHRKGELAIQKMEAKLKYD